jgi:alpha-D-ribose 1-methylphosphonate 5-triphosphate synthase subunit PhnI
MEQAKRELDYLRQILSDSHFARIDVATNLQVVLYHYAKHLLVPKLLSEAELNARLAEEREDGHPLHNLIELMEEKGIVNEDFTTLARRVAELHLRIARDASVEVSYSEVKELLDACERLLEERR